MCLTMCSKYEYHLDVIDNIIGGGAGWPFNERESLHFDYE